MSHRPSTASPDYADIIVVHSNNLPLCSRTTDAPEILLQFVLDALGSADETACVAAHSATGFGDPKSKAHQRRTDVSALFHVRCNVRREFRFMAAVCGEPQGSPVAFGRYANPYTVRHLFDWREMADSTSKELDMTLARLLHSLYPVNLRRSPTISRRSAAP